MASVPALGVSAVQHARPLVGWSGCVLQSKTQLIHVKFPRACSALRPRVRRRNRLAARRSWRESDAAFKKSLARARRNQHGCYRRDSRSFAVCRLCAVCGRAAATRRTGGTDGRQTGPRPRVRPICSTTRIWQVVAQKMTPAVKADCEGDAARRASLASVCAAHNTKSCAHR
jgi:hypothetical protein